MTLSAILLFTGFAVLFRLFARPRWKGASRWDLRGWLLYIASILAVYWLQPATPVRYLDFWFPTLTLALAVCGWALTRQPKEGAHAPEKLGQAGAPLPAVGVIQRATPQAAQRGPDQSVRGNLPAAGVLAGMVLLLGLSRFLDVSNPILPSRPPAFEQTVIAVGFAAAVALGLGWLARRVAPWQKSRSGLLWGSIAVLVLLLVVLKTPAMAVSASAGLRDLMNQSTALAAAGDLRWLGFSYVAFRLIHTLRDRQNGRLPQVTLQEYMVYVIFFPAFTAGPIDRLERFVKDLRAPVAVETHPEKVIGAGNLASLRTPALGLVAAQAWPEWAAAGERLTLGLLKKFVIADGLALAALNATNAAQVNSAGWAWSLAAAYSLQIYFDFSGYTDIAIGLGRLLGFNLPENFNAPYFKQNLTLFWNSWHMTLTNWFRAYYFNPVTRWLRTFKLPGIAGDDESGAGLPPQVIMFVTQLSTFVLIGLWHGVGWNFVLWGTWHGVGLFAQNRWTEAMRPRYAALETRPRMRQAATLFSTALTFVYVTLGWVFFALPDPGLSLRVLGKMFGA